jgi:hypothetical protein
MKKHSLMLSELQINADVKLPWVNLNAFNNSFLNVCCVPGTLLEAGGHGGHRVIKDQAPDPWSVLSDRQSPF